MTNREINLICEWIDKNIENYMTVIRKDNKSTVHYGHCKQLSKDLKTYIDKVVNII